MQLEVKGEVTACQRMPADVEQSDEISRATLRSVSARCSIKRAAADFFDTALVDTAVVLPLLVALAE